MSPTFQGVSQDRKDVCADSGCGVAGWLWGWAGQPRGQAPCPGEHRIGPHISGCGFYTVRGFGQVMSFWFFSEDTKSLRQAGRDVV